MLQSAIDLNSYTIEASDGPIGQLTDQWFDGDDWTVRYLIIETGRWFPGRPVRVPVAAAGLPDSHRHVLPVSLTRAQVRRSPDAIPPLRPDAPRTGHPNLLSGKDITAARVQAADGEIGHVDDLLLDDDDWVVRYLVVDTANWRRGRRVLLSPEWIEPRRWADGRVYVDLTRLEISAAPEYERASGVVRESEEQLHRHYGKQGYWIAATAPQLLSLSQMQDYDVAEGSPDPRQFELVAEDQRPAGVVDDLLIDTGDLTARYLVVRLERRLAGDGEHRVLVPAGHAHVAPDGRRLIADVSSPEQLVVAPAYLGTPVEPDVDRRFEALTRDRPDPHPAIGDVMRCTVSVTPRRR